MSNQTSFAEPLALKDGACPNKPKTVLFVCTGNTCRSPMAQALFNALFANSTALRAESCGIAADSSPISENAVQALIRRGIKTEDGNDYIAHTSKQVTEELIREAEMVIGMTSRHAMELMFRYPAYASKISVMPRDISDPYGGNLAVYERCLGEIEAALSEAFPKNEDDHHE